MLTTRFFDFRNRSSATELSEKASVFVFGTVFLVKTHAFNEHSPGAHGPEVPIMQSCQRPVAAHGCHNGHPEQPCAVTGRWPSSARPHNHTPVHNDRPSTVPIPRRCLLTPHGPGPVVSLHARARTLPTRTRTRHAPLARTTGTHQLAPTALASPHTFLQACGCPGRGCSQLLSVSAVSADPLIVAV